MRGPAAGEPDMLPLGGTVGSSQFMPRCWIVLQGIEIGMELSKEDCSMSVGLR
jgi:hypothetical protein